MGWRDRLIRKLLNHARASLVQLRGTRSQQYTCSCCDDHCGAHYSSHLNNRGNVRNSNFNENVHFAFPYPNEHTRLLSSLVTFYDKSGLGGSLLNELLDVSQNHVYTLNIPSSPAPKNILPAHASPTVASPEYTVGLKMCALMMSINTNGVCVCKQTTTFVSLRK